MNIKIKTNVAIIGLIFILLAIIFLPYYLNFIEYGIAKNTTTWSEYGSYIAGISSVLNLFVFIFLTVYVARLGNLNNRKQIQTQNRIIISQFRQSILDKLDEKLDQLFEININENKKTILSKYTNTSVYLTTFANQKRYLFPILDDDANKLLVDNILIKISEFIDFINQHYGKVQEGDTIYQKINTKVQATAFLKNELIERLQLFILTELEE